MPACVLGFGATKQPNRNALCPEQCMIIILISGTCLSTIIITPHLLPAVVRRSTFCTYCHDSLCSRNSWYPTRRGRITRPTRTTPLMHSAKRRRRTAVEAAANNRDSDPTRHTANRPHCPCHTHRASPNTMRMEPGIMAAVDTRTAAMRHRRNQG